MYDDFYGFSGGDFYGNYGTEFFEFDDYGSGAGGMGGGYRNRGGGRMMSQYPPVGDLSFSFYDVLSNPLNLLYNVCACGCLCETER